MADSRKDTAKDDNTVDSDWLWQQLQDDQLRAQLYDDRKRPYLKFQSRAKWESDRQTGRLKAKQFRQDVYLLLDPHLIKRALTDLSMDPNKALGSGTAMLASDCPADWMSEEMKAEVGYQNHAAKRAVMLQAVRNPRMESCYAMLSALACHHAMVLPRKQKAFNFVSDYAEQAALIFTAGMFGIPSKFHYLLQETNRDIYTAMVYQMFARHFVTKPTCVSHGNAAMGKLAEQIAEIIAQARNPRYLREFTALAQRDSGRVKKAVRTILKKLHSNDQVTADNDAVVKFLASKTNGRNPALADMHEYYRDKLKELRKFTLSKGAGFEFDELRTVLLQFDHALNMKATREWMTDNLSASILGLDNATDIDHEVLAIVRRMVRDKEAPIDDLIPTRLDLLDGEYCHARDEDRKIPLKGNYYIRPTIIDLMMESPGGLTDGELVVEIVGAISGTIGNIVASASITLAAIFSPDPNQRDLSQALRNAVKNALFDGLKIQDNRIMDLPSRLPRPDSAVEKQNFFAAAQLGARAAMPFVKEACRLDSPAAFLPRRVIDPEGWDPDPKLLPEGIPFDTEIVLGMGALTRRSTCERDKPAGEFEPHRSDQHAHSLLFGYDRDNDSHTHRCPANHDGLSMHLTANIVANFIRLRDVEPRNIGLKNPLAGLEERLAPILRKKWGFICENLEVEHARDQDMIQKPLNVIMRVKSPTGVHAKKLKNIIRYGAPTIQYLLETSEMVHFARFVFLNNDTELGLFTSYDGDFDDYLRHFADVAGPLFDRICEHLVDAVPKPVRENPSSFIDLIKRYDRPSVANYFFSADPTVSVKSRRECK